MRFLLSWTRAVKETNKRFFQIETLNLQMVDSAFSTNDTQCKDQCQDERRHPEEDQRGQKCSGYMYILTDLLCDCGLKGAECIFA